MLQKPFVDSSSRIWYVQGSKVVLWVGVPLEVTMGVALPLMHENCIASSVAIQAAVCGHFGLQCTIYMGTKVHHLSPLPKLDFIPAVSIKLWIQKQISNATNLEEAVFESME